MYKVVFDIHHKTCFGSDINLKFSNHEFSSVDCRWIKNTVAHLLKVEGDHATFPSILLYLQQRLDVLRVEPLSRNKNTIFLRAITKKDDKYFPFSDFFSEHGLDPLSPTKFIEKYERWTLGSAKKTNITKVYQLLKKRFALRVVSITEQANQPLLTEKQRKVFTYAFHFGYYEWPRKITVTKLSTTLNIPKTVLLSHLRKAEQKIIRKHMSSHIS